MRCQVCDTRNDKSSHFCAGCGRELPFIPASQPRKKNVFLKMAIIFLLVIVIIAGTEIPSFAAQSASAPKEGSSSEEKVGLFRVLVDGKWGYIDKAGKIVIKPQFDDAWCFSEGLADVTIGGKEGFIDKTGRIVIKPQFDLTMMGFHEGLAAVQIGDKWGFIDKTGKTVIKSQFDMTLGFIYEGLAEVVSGGKKGYIDKTGRYVWKASK